MANYLKPHESIAERGAQSGLHTVEVAGSIPATPTRNRSGIPEGLKKRNHRGPSRGPSWSPTPAAGYDGLADMVLAFALTSILVFGALMFGWITVR